MRRKVQRPAARRVDADVRRPKLSKAWVDEEIESDSDDSNDENKNDDDDVESDQEQEEAQETVDQKRRRLALTYLEKIKIDKHASDDDALRDALQVERQKLQGKYFRKFEFERLIPEILSTTRYNGHKLAITDVALSSDDKTAVTSSKDNSVILWDIETGKKTFLKKQWTRKDFPTQQASAGETLAVAISSDSTFIVSGGRDRIIRVYDPRIGGNNEIKNLQGHRDAVTSLVFRKDTHTLFSASLDRTLKHWDLDELAYIETMFGHQEGVLAMDCGGRNKPLSVSGDRTARLWSVEEESHLLFRSKMSGLECVQYISDETFVTGGQDGAIALWHIGLKKPAWTVPAAHGREALSPRWICSMACTKTSDLLVTGSYDGFIKWWKVGGEKMNELTHQYDLPVTGFVNAIALSQRLLVAGVGKEHKFGRWWNMNEASNQLLVVKLPEADDNNDI